jgi:hypothetical protein
MATQYTFQNLRDRGRKFIVTGDGSVTGYSIAAEHVKPEPGKEPEAKNVVDEYNKENYPREQDELDAMGEMHSAYKEGDKARLLAAIAAAEQTFQGSKGVIGLYRYAATKL